MRANVEGPDYSKNLEPTLILIDSCFNLLIDIDKNTQVFCFSNGHF